MNQGSPSEWPGSGQFVAFSECTPIDPCGLNMVSWWDDCEHFASYMRSEDHSRSHARIPRGDLRPRPRRFARYEVIAR